MTYYIYCITNQINNKTYIGQRKCPANKTPETDSYMGSGTYLKNSKKKYGIENFSKSIIAICGTSENADILEKVFIALYRAEGKAEYNMADGGVSHFSMNCETKKKLSESHKGKKLSDEHKKKISESNKEYYINHPERKEKICKISRKLSEDTKMKISLRNKGRKCTEEFKEKCRQRQFGKHHSEETRQKMSLARKGKKHTEETIKKMIKNHVGSKEKHWNLSIETRQKMSESMKGKNIWTKKYKWFNNGEINVRCEICPKGFQAGRKMMMK